MRRPRDPRTSLRRELAALAAHLGADELRVLVLLATRVWVGQAGMAASTSAAMRGTCAGRPSRSSLTASSTSPLRRCKAPDPADSGAGRDA